MILYSHGCIFTNKSAYDSHKRGLQKRESFRYNKEDIMDGRDDLSNYMLRYVISNILNVLNK